MDIVIEIVGTYQTFFREISRTDLQDIARTFSVDDDLEKASRDVWNLSEPVSLESTDAVAFAVIDDETDPDSCRTSWLEIHEQLEDERTDA